MDSKNRHYSLKAVALGTAVAMLLGCFPLDLGAEPGDIVGDIVLLGTVERSGRRLTNDATLFEGDTIRTASSSGGVLRLGGARMEIGQSTYLEIVRAEPLTITLSSGSLAFNFPDEFAFEITTPQLEVRPNPESRAVSGEILAIPEDEDRVESRNGSLSILERQEHGAIRIVNGGEILIASLVPTVSIPVASPTFAPLQAPTPIAQFQAVEGDVRLQRVNTTLTTRVENPGIALFNGDSVSTLQGRADILFTDQSLISLDVGTTVTLEEQPQPTGIFRRITQGLGNLFFDIQQVVGTETSLETPTAVAAIRGTEGNQIVPNETQSTHALNEGLEDITERITQQTVTITDGQQVTAIRGVGFTPIVALLALIPRPGIGGGGGAAGGGAAGGGAGAGAGAGAGGAAGGAAGAAAGAATSTVTSVASVAAATAATAAGVTAAVVIPTTSDEPEPEDTATVPLSRPGGELTTGGELTAALSVPIASRSGPPPASASAPGRPLGRPPDRSDGPPGQQEGGPPGQPEDSPVGRP